MKCQDSFSVFILHYIPILLSHSIRIQLILRLTYLVSRILFMFGIWMFPFYKTDVLFRSISSFSFVELSTTVKCQKWFFFFTLPPCSLSSIYMVHVSLWEFICHNFFFFFPFRLSILFFMPPTLVCSLCLDVRLCVCIFRFDDLFWFVICSLLAMSTIDLTMFKIFAFFFLSLIQATRFHHFFFLLSSLPLFNLTLCNTQMIQSVLLHTNNTQTCPSSAQFTIPFHIQSRS